MSAFPYLVLLLFFVELGTIHVSASTPSPTPNPECPGMHRVAKSLEKGLETYTKETTICRVNNACTGLMCNGTHKQNDFYMKMELKHCKTPPAIHLDLKYKKINVHKEMQDGQLRISSIQKNPVLSVPVELKLTLKKNRNRMTAGLKIQVCPPVKCQTLATLLPPITFCLNMKTCAGYNSTGDTPCHVNPTGNPVSTMTRTSSPGALSTTKRSSPTSRPRTRSPTHHSESYKTVSTKVVPTALRFSTIKPSHHSEPAKPVSTLRSSIKPTIQNSSGTTSLPGDTHALKRGSGHNHISTGVAIGIAFACVVGVLIIVGAAFYWKKFYRRSRLRAAYYNDISMNDPLYEDFGPEVA